MKKKIYIVYVLLLIVATAIGIIFFIIDNQKKKLQEEKNELRRLYYCQNTALKLCGDLSKRYYFHGADEINLEQFCVELYVYNYSRTKYKLTIDEVLNYLGEEYDEDGRPRIYSQPDNIENYIRWEIHIGHEMSDSFRWDFIYYLKENSSKKINEMSYQEIMDALEEYQNSPDFVPPGQN